MSNKGETVAGIQAIKTGEKDLMDSITADLDWSVLQEMIRRRHHLEITDDLEFSGGDLVVHDNQVAYQLNFEVKVVLSVLLDRDGRCIFVRTPAEVLRKEDAPKTPEEEISLAEAVAEQDALPVQGERIQEMPEEESEQGPLGGLPDVSEMTADALGDVSDASSADSDPLDGLPDVSEMTADALGDVSDASSADSDPFDGLPDVSEMTADALGDFTDTSSADSDPLDGLPDVSEMTMDALEGAADSSQDPFDGLPDVAEMTMDALSANSGEGLGQGMI